MKSVNIAELKNSLSAYLRIVRSGEEIVIRDRNLPVAKLIPFPAGDATEEEMQLVAEGKLRLPERPFDYDAFWRLPIPKVAAGVDAIKVLIEDREDRF